MTKWKEMGHSARLYFTLLHLANLHFSFQCINVNSSKFNNISVINVPVIKMHQYVFYVSMFQNVLNIIMYISMYQTKNVAILI